MSTDCQSTGRIPSSVQVFKISQGGDALRNCSRQLVVIQAPVPERVRNLSCRTLWMTHNVSNWTNCPIESGMGPLNWFSYSSLGFCSVCQCQDLGSSYKLQRLVKEERVGGMGPSSLFFCNHLCSVQVSVERVCDIPMTSLTLSPIAWRNQRNQESTLSIPLRPGCWWFRELLGGLFMKSIVIHLQAGRPWRNDSVQLLLQGAHEIWTITLQICPPIISAPLDFDMDDHIYSSFFVPFTISSSENGNPVPSNRSITFFGFISSMFHVSDDAPGILLPFTITRKCFGSCWFESGG